MTTTTKELKGVKPTPVVCKKPENVQKLIESIRRAEVLETFRMQDVFGETGIAVKVFKQGRRDIQFTECGSPACLAGWTMVIKNNGRVPEEVGVFRETNYYVQVMSKFYGLPKEVCECLFFGRWFCEMSERAGRKQKSLVNITAFDAIDILQGIVGGRVYYDGNDGRYSFLEYMRYWKIEENDRQYNGTY